MKIIFDSLQPVYMQIAVAIEDEIISGTLPEGAAAYSQLILARDLQVNPATAAKGINLLVAKGVLEKQRGANMTVAHGAREKLLDERRETKINDLISDLVTEAKKTGVDITTITQKIAAQMQQEEAT